MFKQPLTVGGLYSKLSGCCWSVRLLKLSCKKLWKCKCSVDRRNPQNKDQLVIIEAYKIFIYYIIVGVNMDNI